MIVQLEHAQQQQHQHQPALVVIITDHVLMEIPKRNVPQEQQEHGIVQMIVQLEHAQQLQWLQHVAATVFTYGTDRLGDYHRIHVPVVVPHQQEVETIRQRQEQVPVLKI